jgi:CheY-like chemotaxis protein
MVRNVWTRDETMGAILVVDDDVQVLEVISQILRLEGHQVTTARDGRDAISKFKATTFDLVITDLIMPEREGLETIAELKAFAQRTPVIAMSGGGRVGPTDYLETAQFIGANATLAKPFARSELVRVVNSMLNPQDENRQD